MSRAYPLLWPRGWPRTKAPTTAQFRTSLTGAMKNVNEELHRFASDSSKKIDAIVISSNFSLGDQNPKEPGVVCYFNFDGEATCIPVDRYKKIEHNLQAIFHCLEAERTKLRHGGINLVMAAFRGYAMLEGPKNSSEAWWVTLRVTALAERDEVEAAYKKLRSKYHPDKPDGDETKFKAVQAAWKEYQQ